MIGAIPAGLFGLDPKAVPQQPAQAFTWGAGGARMTPDELAMQQQIAMQNQQAGMDTSPVGHWAQGLARVAQALVGNVQQGRVNKASSANADYEQQILQSLTGGAGNDQGTLAALSSPYLGEGAKDALKLQWQAGHKAAPQPSEFERTLLASGYQQGTPQWTQANQARLQNYTDPTINVPLPGGRVYVGPRSGLTAATGGGGPASTAPVGGAPPPATLPPDFDFDQGGPASQAPAGFR
jgi:hypothetical protein